MHRLAAFALLALGAAGACDGAPDARLQPPSRAARDSGTSEMSYAVVRVTRTLLYDEHPSAGGGPPDVRNDTRRVEIDYQSRRPDERPLVRTYAARIAVPSDRPGSWELPLGDDYRLLIVTEGFSRSDDGITIDGRMKSNYEIQLDPSSARTGPNAFHLGSSRLPVGQSGAVEVLNDEIAGRTFHEYQEIEVEAVVSSPPEGIMTGIGESVDAQQRRWDEWTPVRKSGLR